MTDMIIGPPPETKWEQFKSKFKLHPAVQAALVTGVIGLSALSLKSCSEATALSKQLSKRDDELTSVRLTNQELHRENLHMKGILSPIEAKARELYPNLEISAAVAKLSKDLDSVRTLATRDVHRPLSQDLRARIVASLSLVAKEAPHKPPVVTISLEMGSRNRQRVADDLVAVLKEGGLQSSIGSISQSFFRRTPAPLVLRFNPKDKGLAQALADALSPYLNTAFQGDEDEKQEAGLLEVTINGDPQFLPNGALVFK